MEKTDLSPAATGVDKIVYRDVPNWMRDANALWRGDRRSPDEIRRALGFEAHNTDDMNMKAHVGEASKENGKFGYGYVSTSMTEHIGAERGMADGGAVYKIRAPGGILTDSTMSEAGHYGRGEDEVLFPGGIKWEYVEGWQVASRDPATGRIVLGDFVPNPDFIGNKLAKDFFNPPPDHSALPSGPDGAAPDRTMQPPLSQRLNELPYSHDHLHKYRDNVHATQAGMSIFSGRDDQNQLYTGNQVKPTPGTFVVDMHTSPDGARIGKDGLTADDVGEIILANPDWKPPTPVTLFGCDAGALPDGFAAQLSAKIGAEVHAPTTGMWVDQSGNAFATSTHHQFNGPKPGWPPNGEWRTFSPDGTVQDHPSPYPPGHEPSWGDNAPENAPRTAAHRGDDGGSTAPGPDDVRSAEPDVRADDSGHTDHTDQAEHTHPSGDPDPDAQPQGPPARVLDQQREDMRRALTRENESASILAQAGYQVEQNPSVPGAKNPDYRIEGKVFDNYAPSRDNARNIASEIQHKVDAGQTDRVILNLSDSNVDLDKMRAQLNDWPIDGLKEVIAIDKNGDIISLYPSEADGRDSTNVDQRDAPAPDDTDRPDPDTDRPDDTDRPEPDTADQPDPDDTDQDDGPASDPDSAPSPDTDDQDADSADDQPPSGPDALPDHLRRVYDNSIETPAGRAFYSPDDERMQRAANAIVPDPDRYTVDVHANATHAVVDGKRVSATELAAMITADPNYTPGQPVRLVACEAGRDPDGFAAQLARELGAEVVAADKKVSNGANGKPVATDTYVDADGKTRAVRPPNGQWHTFHPDGTRTESTGPDGYPPHRPSAPDSTSPSHSKDSRDGPPHHRDDTEAADVRSAEDDTPENDKTTPQSDDHTRRADDDDPANRPRPANTLGPLPTPDHVARYMDSDAFKAMVERANEIKVEPNATRVGDAITQMLPRHPAMVRMLTHPDMGYLRDALLARPETLRNLMKYTKAVDVLEDCVNEVRSHPGGPLAVAEKYESDPKPPPAILEPHQTALSNTVHELVSKTTENYDKQPPFNGLPKDHENYRSAYLDHLYKDWGKKQKMLHKFADAIANATQGVAHSRKEAKSKIRANDKLDGRSPGDLTDIVGSKIQYDTIEDAYRGLAKVIEMSTPRDSKVSVVDFSDRFGKPQSSGYRDLQMSVSLDLGEGKRHVAELRLHLKSIDVVADYEHALFEVRRDFASLAANTPEERALVGAILNVERVRFAHAFKIGNGRTPE